MKSLFEYVGKCNGGGELYIEYNLSDDIDIPRDKIVDYALHRIIADHAQQLSKSKSKEQIMRMVKSWTAVDDTK